MDLIIRRLTTRYLFTIADNVINALLKRQHFVTLSLIKAKYIKYC